MKLLSKKRQQGGVLVVTLVTCVVIGIVLASFLAVISNRYKLTVRSMGWNAAIPVLEAGIEEAFAHLHKTPGNPAADSWTATTVGGQPVHTKQRYFTDGSYYNVSIYNALGANPVIYSSGFTPSPLESGKYISRMVRVTTTNPPNIFVRPITTTQGITLGGSVFVDGFNSAAGPYNVTSNRLANGGLASVGSVIAGSANVYGAASSGAAGTVDVGSGAVGDIAWNASNKGIQPGWSDNDFNAAFPTNAPPGGGPFSPPVTTSVGTSNIMFLPTGTNQINSVSISKNSDPIIVTGNATLWVTGDFSITGTGAIRIMTNASLTLYIGGELKLNGGGVANDTGLASQFSIIGLSSNTKITYGGNSDFTGTILAPQADVTLNGTTAFYGTVISKSFKSIGTAEFHYDEALAKEIESGGGPLGGVVMG